MIFLFLDEWAELAHNTTIIGRVIVLYINALPLLRFGFEGLFWGVQFTILWSSARSLLAICLVWLCGNWCLLPEGTQYLQEVGSRASEMFCVFHLFQVVSVPFAVLRTFGGVSNCAITGFRGYLIILGSTWFCKIEAVGNYQFLLVDSLNSFCHAVLQLHNAANKNIPTVFTGAAVCLTLAVLTCCTLVGGDKKEKKLKYPWRSCTKRFISQNS